MEKDTKLKKKKEVTNIDDTTPKEQSLYNHSLTSIKYKPLPKFKGCTNC